MFLWKSSFVALSPGGSTWEETWQSLLSSKQDFSQAHLSDKLISWPSGPAMGLIRKWPETTAPAYLDRTTVLVQKLSSDIRPHLDAVDISQPGTRWGVVFGSSHGDPGPGSLCAEHGVDGVPIEQRHRILGADLSEPILAGLERHIPIWIVHGACASGIVTLYVARCLLEARRLDAVVVVCADTLSRVAYAGFHRVAAMSRTGCKPFDQDRDGMTLSEAGAAMIVALRPTHHQDCVVRSASINCDRTGMVEPSAAGVGSVVEHCLGSASVNPSDIDFVFWHGTGTKLNDEAEYLATKSVFRGSPPPGTSSKGSFGHTMGASSLLNVMAACETLNTKTLPGCTGMTRAAYPEMNIAQATRVLKSARNGLCVALGFGGINAAVVLAGGSAPQ